jgi:hypothetical protein
MSEKKKFLLRVDGDLYSAMEKWAADDLRSVNAQIEFLLTDFAKKTGRLAGKDRQRNSQSHDEASKPLST